MMKTGRWICLYGGLYVRIYHLYLSDATAGGQEL